MESKTSQFGCRCTEEQSKRIKLYISRCKTKYDEKSSEVLLNALELYYEKIKGSDKFGG